MNVYHKRETSFAMSDITLFKITLILSNITKLLGEIMFLYHCQNINIVNNFLFKYFFVLLMGEIIHSVIYYKLV